MNSVSRRGVLAAVALLGGAVCAPLAWGQAALAPTGEPIRIASHGSGQHFASHRPFQIAVGRAIGFAHAARRRWRQ